MTTDGDWELLELELGERVVDGLLDEEMFGPEIHDKITYGTR